MTKSTIVIKARKLFFNIVSRPKEVLTFLAFNNRITEAGDTRITEDGATRITEDTTSTPEIVYVIQERKFLFNITE